MDAAFTGISWAADVGDGKILVTHLDQAIRIRTGETGAHAV